MTASSRPHPSTAIRRPSRGRPPGIHSPGRFWIFVYLASWAGLAIDAILAAAIVGQTFNLVAGANYAIVATIGLLVALAATKAASWQNSDYPSRTFVALLGVAGVGLCLAWLRLSAGVAAAPKVDPSAYAMVVVERPNHELPATGLMLALYAMSAVSVYLTALKLFVPARDEFRRYGAECRVAVEQLGQLEGERVATRERVAYREEMARLLDEQLDHALAEADARELHLKAYARDAIARAVGDPGATPLVRAPHEPGTADPGADDAESRSPS